MQTVRDFNNLLNNKKLKIIKIVSVRRAIVFVHLRKKLTCILTQKKSFSRTCVM